MCDEPEGNSIPKKRGRKPKPKVDVFVPKKKRGRKKKCEIDIETSKKITSFMRDGQLLDQKLFHLNQSQVGGSSSSSETQAAAGGESIHNHDDIANSERIAERETIFLGKLKIEKTSTLESPKQIFQLEPSTLPVVGDEAASVTTGERCLINFQEVMSPLVRFDELERNEKTSKQKFPWISEESQQQIQQQRPRALADQRTNNLFQPIEVTRKVQILQVYKGNSNVYPIQTEIWCWWCAHPFETPPCFIPTRHDSLRNRYQIMGNFCSWNCAKAFLVYENGKFCISDTMHLFTSMVKQITGSILRIKCAPPRYDLKPFGGSLTIEEFRSSFANNSPQHTLQRTNFELDDYKIIHRNLTRRN